MNTNLVTLDVRADIRAGRSPLATILDAAAKLGQGEALRLLAPFKPVPLFDILGRRGFRHSAKALTGNDWEVVFTPKSRTTAVGNQPEVNVATKPAGFAVDSSHATELDARGLEPPQPLVKILEAVAALSAGMVLRARTDRRPMHLYALLEERGFSGESEEQADGSFITQIQRR